MSEQTGRKKGWHPDPYGIHAERFYYLDNKPGRLVRDHDRVQSYDDIPGWAEPVEVDEVPPMPLRPTPPFIPGIAAAAATPSPLSTSAPEAQGHEPGVLEDAAWVAAATARPLDTPAVTTDYFPDEPVRWRNRAAARLSWIRRTPRPSRRTWYIIGSVGIAVILGVVLFSVLPGPDHSPASAQLTPKINPQLRVPSNFLNGGRSAPQAAGAGTGANTDSSTTTTTTTGPTPPTATTESWSLSQTFGASAQSLSAVACPTTTQCYAVGQTTFKTGMVLVSSDGGSTWAQHNVPAGVASLAAIACTSATSCVAVGGNSVLITSDSGTAWSAASLGQNALTTVTCASPTSCVAGGSNAPVTSGCDSGSTYTTSNGGQSWSTTVTHCFVPSAIVCADPSQCVMVGTHTNGSGQSGEVLVSRNAGKSWQSRYVLIDSNTQLSAVSCASTQDCVAAGNSPSQAIIRTHNGGQTWTKADPGVPIAQRYFLAVECGSVQVCSAGGSAGPVTTTDGGATWSAVGGTSIAKITGISCPSTTACVGVAVSAQGSPATIKLA